MNLEELFDYKNNLMRDLCTNEEVVKCVTCNEHAAVPNHGLPYTQIFPYEYIPETVGEGKTFICFDVDIVSVPNKTYYYPVIYIWVFTHKSQMRAPGGGVLLDKLSSVINEHMNGNRTYGLGELKLDSVRRFKPITDYLGRVLTYTTKDFNRNIRFDQPPNRKELNR